MIAGDRLVADERFAAPAHVLRGAFERRLELGRGKIAVRGQVQVEMVGSRGDKSILRGSRTLERKNSICAKRVAVKLFDSGQFTGRSRQGIKRLIGVVANRASGKDALRR